MITLGEVKTRRQLDDMEVRNALKVDLVGKALFIVLKDLWHQIEGLGLSKK